MPITSQMLKFRWSTRCWETLQGKNDTRPLLEEAAAAVHRLGLVPMPPGSPLRLVYDEMTAHGRNGDGIAQHSAIGSNSPAGTSDASRTHSASHADGVIHTASLGVPPVAAGVLRDLRREGALNGEAVSVWGDGGVNSAEMQRALNAPAPGPDTSALSLPPVEGISGVTGAATGASIPGQWVQPPVPVAGNANGKRKAGAAFAETALSEADADW